MHTVNPWPSGTPVPHTLLFHCLSLTYLCSPHQHIAGKCHELSHPNNHWMVNLLHSETLLLTQISERSQTKIHHRLLSFEWV